MGTNNEINLTTAGIAGYDGLGTFSGSTMTQYSLLSGGATTDTIVNLGVATDGQLPIGATSSSLALANLTPGTGINIVNSSGSIEISAVGSGMTWYDVGGPSYHMFRNMGYTISTVGEPSPVDMTLPSFSVYGDLVAVVGNGSLWTISDYVGQTIHFGSRNTTLGYLQSTGLYDVAVLLCTATGTDYTVIYSIGNITVA